MSNVRWSLSLGLGSRGRTRANPTTVVKLTLAQNPNSILEVTVLLWDGNRDDVLLESLRWENSFAGS